MKTKSVKSAKKVNTKDAIIKKLCDSLKMKAEDVVAIAQLEKVLLQQKAEKLSAKQKVTRQKMRNKRFFRHEYTAEVIADVQKLSTLV